MSVLYKSSADFQTFYYGKIGGEPLSSKNDFQELAPIIVMDLSRQNDAVKISVVDLKIEFEMIKQTPTKT